MEGFGAGRCGPCICECSTQLEPQRSGGKATSTANSAEHSLTVLEFFRVIECHTEEEVARETNQTVLALIDGFVVRPLDVCARGRGTVVRYDRDRQSI